MSDPCEVMDLKAEKLKEFREKVLDVLEPDKDNENYLIRWLIARKFDVEKAEIMIRKQVRFAQVNGLDKMDTYTPHPATDYLHTKLLGYDNAGSIVRLIHLGASDLKGLTLSISHMDSIRFATYILVNDAKKQKEDIAEAEKCTKQIYIFDLNGLNWRSIIHRSVADRTFKLLKTYEENHPESLKIVYVVNAPSFFSFIHNWLTTVLPESILAKVKIVTQEERQSVLAEHIDPSILPASIGGTKTDKTGDPNCPSMYKMPLNVLVPESMLLQNQFEVLDNDPLAIKHLIEKGEVFALETVITEPNSTLQWDFQTNYYDIKLGLNFKASQNAPWEQIIPFHRVDSHMFPSSGSFHCQFPGMYELVFDNTYSWFTSKQLTYKVTTLPPGRENDS